MDEKQATKQDYEAQYAIIRELTDYETVGKLDPIITSAYCVLMRLLLKKIKCG